MQVSYSKKFLKQLADISAEFRPKIENFVFEELVNATSLAELGWVKLKKCRDIQGVIKSGLVIIDSVCILKMK